MPARQAGEQMQHCKGMRVRPAGKVSSTTPAMWHQTSTLNLGVQHATTAQLQAPSVLTCACSSFSTRLALATAMLACRGAGSLRDGLRGTGQNGAKGPSRRAHSMPHVLRCAAPHLPSLLRGILQLLHALVQLAPEGICTTRQHG